MSCKKVSVWTCGCDVKYVTAGLEELYIDMQIKNQRKARDLWLPRQQTRFYCKCEVGSPSAMPRWMGAAVGFVADL